MQFETLAKSHNKKAFDCGNISINHYLQQFASQHDKKGIAKTHVLAKEEMIIGFYTLSNAFIDNQDGKITGFPRQIPAIIIGRIGVDKNFKGQGLSKILLSHALKKIGQLAQDTGIAFVIIDAKDESLATYYQQFGFHKTDVPFRMILAVNKIAV